MAEGLIRPAHALPFSLERLQANDAEELGEAISGTWFEVEQLFPGPVVASITHAAVGPFRLNHGTTLLPMRARGPFPDDGYTLSLIPHTEGGVWNGVVMEPTQAMLVPPGYTLDGTTGPRYEYLTLSIPEELTLSILETLESHPPNPAQGSLYFRIDPHLLTAIHTLALDTFKQLETFDPTDGRNPALEQTPRQLQILIENILANLPSKHGPLDVPPIFCAGLAVRGEEIMRAHLSDPPTISDLCRLLRVSRRSLEYAFQRTFGTSPLQHLRMLRFNEVRRRLKARNPHETSVTQEALAMGFYHLGAFSVDYRRLYGESPSETLARPS
jgi:AraC family ethanolamine operon transcriptional activator